MGLVALLLPASCRPAPDLKLIDPDCPEAAVAALAYTRPAPEAGIRHTNIFAVDHDLDEFRLTDDGASYDPSFSPNSDRIVFVSGRDGGASSGSWTPMAPVLVVWPEPSRVFETPRESIGRRTDRYWPSITTAGTGSLRWGFSSSTIWTYECWLSGSDTPLGRRTANI